MSLNSAPVRAGSRDSPPNAHAGDQRVTRDRRLFERCRTGAGAPVDRDALVTRFLPLARQLASRYTRPPEPFEDVYQVACMALIKAVERYDPGRDVAFSSYAVPTIVGEIKRYYRDHTWVVHVPRDLSELALQVQRVAAELSSRAGHAATRTEIAEALGVREQDVADARAALQARRPDSFDARPELDDEEPGPPSHERRCATEDMGFERAEQRALGAALLRYLPPRDREVLHLYYEADMTQKAIGKRLGISQMQVSRILTRSLQRLQQLPHGLESASTSATPMAA
jgi:RNA polymerase sigma-B factor